MHGQPDRPTDPTRDLRGRPRQLRTGQGAARPGRGAHALLRREQPLHRDPGDRSARHRQGWYERFALPPHSSLYSLKLCCYISNR